MNDHSLWRFVVSTYLLLKIMILFFFSFFKVAVTLVYYKSHKAKGPVRHANIPYGGAIRDTDRRKPIA